MAQKWHAVESAQCFRFRMLNAAMKSNKQVIGFSKSVKERANPSIRLAAQRQTHSKQTFWLGHISPQLVIVQVKVCEGDVSSE